MTTIKPWLASIGQVIKPHRERLMLALFILIPAWLLFLVIVGPLKIDTTAALIMIWATVSDLIPYTRQQHIVTYQED